MATLVSRMLDVAFPAACSGCGREGAPLCPECLPALHVRTDLPPGTPIGLPADIPRPLLQLEWCAPFAGVVRRALHDLKYAGEQRLAEPLGEAVARRWDRAGVGGDVIVNAPVHDERRRRRGYDQAELIAAVAARNLGVPFAPILRRVRATAAQFDLDRIHRADNVAGAFGLVGPAREAGEGSVHEASPAERRLRGRWVVLVDDVVTTGSTLAACADVLIEAGAMGVSAITVARER